MNLYPAHAKLFLALLFVVLLVFSSRSDAEQKQVFGKYDVHYMVFPSSFIPAEVAARYNIVRARERMVLNISVREQLAENKTIERAATVTGVRRDLLAKEYEIDFREIKEQGAIYYLADFLVINEEILRFEIDLGLADEEPMSLKFEQKMYVDK